jgi:triosephosphate isomerase
MKLIIANWKMNPKRQPAAIKLARLTDLRGVVIAPPMLFLALVGRILRKAELAAQDVFWEEAGAFTGAVSPTEEKSIGVSYVIVGHSERRKFFDETDKLVNKKLKAVLRNKLKAVLCVGEPWSVRKRGFTAAKNFVKKQLQSDLKGIRSSIINHRSLIIAYEPVWAIGTRRNDSPEDAAEMANFIKKLLVVSYKLKVKVLYGGSVTLKNIRDFAHQSDLDGFLIGGASLKAMQFRKIVEIVKKAN